MKRLAVALIVLSSTVVVHGQQGLQISLKNKSESEQKKMNQLERLHQQGWIQSTLSLSVYYAHSGFRGKQ
jgi:hypothetical protein